MSDFEALHWKTTDPGEEPVMALETTTGQELLARRENTKLFTYLGRSAFDNIFLISKCEDEGYTGSFIWRTDNKDTYEIMAGFMITSAYPSELNALTVPTNVLEAYYKHAASKETQEDFFPSEWELGSNE